jgi:hypothetical protein
MSARPKAKRAAIDDEGGDAGGKVRLADVALSNKGSIPVPAITVAKAWCADRSKTRSMAGGGCTVTGTTTKNRWDPFKEWDVITGTTDGGVIWRRYGDGLIVLARRGEDPNDAIERHLRRERKRRHELPPLPPT